MPVVEDHGAGHDIPVEQADERGAFLIFRTLRGCQDFVNAVACPQRESGAHADKQPWEGLDFNAGTWSCIGITRPPEKHP